MEYLDKWASLGKVIKFLYFGTNLTKIPHPVQARKPSKVNNFEIGVARKLDLIGPN